MIGELHPEILTRRSLEHGRTGYLSLLHLDDPQPVDDLWSLHWGRNCVIMLESGNR